MKKILFFTLFISFIFFSICCFFVQEPYLKINFIDVGEGDAILIQAPNGKSALVDAGNLISGYRAAEYLKKKNIQNLDYLIFTHPHADHIGGAFFLLQMVDVKGVYDNAEDLTGLVSSSDIHRWYEQLVRSKANYRVLKAKDTLALGRVTLRVLWPPHPLPFSDFNANSLVIMVEYGESRCLLTGDLTIPGEKELLKYGLDLKADLLKVGHHGADDATGEAFLQAVSPRLAIISVNKDNIRGYPSASVVKRLENAGIKIYRTDRDGDVLITIRPNGQFNII